MRLATVLLATSLILGACDNGNGGDDDGPPPSTVPAGGPVDVVSVPIEGGNVALSAEPDPLAAGGPVVWAFVVTNAGDQALTFTFSSGQRGDVVLSQDGDEVYRWSAGRVFTQAVEEVTVAPGSEEVFELEGALEVEPGVYDLTAELTADPAPPPMETTIEVVEPS